MRFLWSCFGGYEAMRLLWGYFGGYDMRMFWSCYEVVMRLFWGWFGVFMRLWCCYEVVRRLFHLEGAWFEQLDLVILAERVKSWDTARKFHHVFNRRTETLWESIPDLLSGAIRQGHGTRVQRTRLESERERVLFIWLYFQVKLQHICSVMDGVFICFIYLLRLLYIIMHVIYSLYQIIS